MGAGLIYDFDAVFAQIVAEPIALLVIIPRLCLFRDTPDVRSRLIQSAALSTNDLTQRIVDKSLIEVPVRRRGGIRPEGPP